MLYQKLIQHSQYYSFHMPGHKAGRIAPLAEQGLNLYQLDATEVGELDDLHHPTGVIRQLEQALCQIYQSKQTFISVNGSTGAILSAIAALTEPGDKIALARNCHKSVYHAAAINQLQMDWIWPQFDSTIGVFGRLSAAQVANYFQEIKQQQKKSPKLVVITSPTYEGLVSDISAISQVVHQNQAQLLVDEAHGAHYPFADQLPVSAINQGADIVVQSTHKTLPCLTQTALLHLSQTSSVPEQAVRYQLDRFETSSPSYLLLASVEQGIQYMQQHRTSYAEWIDQIKDFLTKSKSTNGYWLNHESQTSDITRLTYVLKTEQTGYQLAQKLAAEYQIYVELAGINHIVCIVTMADTMADIVYLQQAIDQVLSDQTAVELNKKEVLQLLYAAYFQPNQPLDQRLVREVPIGIYDSTGAEIEVALPAAVGRPVSGDIIPYPPGIPLLHRGERITNSQINYISYLLQQRQTVYPFSQA